jgi:hypothetical protein
MEENSKNWINFTLGGLILHGDHGQAAHQLRASDNLIEGIEDLHLERTLPHDVLVKLDGHALAGNDDYLARLEISKEDVGYIRAGYSQYRTWYDGNGGFFPFPAYEGGLFFSPTKNVMGLDRSQVFFEAGLRNPNLPEVTFRYERDTRHGQKDSTIWGDSSLTGIGDRKIAPAFRDINEVRDLFSLDLAHSLGNTDIQLGVRFEHLNNEDSLNLSLYPNQLSQTYVTQHDGTQGDLFNAHGSTVTRFGDKVWFSLGYGFTTFNTDISGSRVYGPGYDTEFNPMGVPMMATGEGFYNLMGGSEWSQHVATLNLMWKPLPSLSVIAATRFESQRTDSSATFLDTDNGGDSFALTKILEQSTDDTTRVAESLELRYTGLDNWVFFSRGDWMEETGTVIDQVTDTTDPTNPDFADIDRDRLQQKYTLGANWYACPRATFSAQYYHKFDDIHYSNSAIPPGPASIVGESIGFPGRFSGQKFDVNDLKTRMTLRVLSNLSAATEYDFQRTEYDTNTFGLGLTDSGKTTSHVLSESLTWSPLSRLYLQAGACYYLSRTEVPATIVVHNLAGDQGFDFKNNHWTLNASAGLAIDEKTNLRADYTFYKADNYENIAFLTVPYGAGAEQHTVTLTLNRQITKSVSASLKGGYYQYKDETSGHHNDYSGLLVFSGLHVRF